MNNRTAIPKALFIIFLLRALVPAHVFAAPGPSDAPQPATTEYFTTSSAGLLVSLEPETLKIASYTYVIAYKVNKPFSHTVFAEIEFQNPEYGKESLKSTRTITPEDKELAIRSPPVSGVKESEIYTVVLRVYADKNKSKLITEHVQRVHAPTPYQTQLIIALQKKYSLRECTGMKAKLFGPPAWYFKEVATSSEAGGNTVACFLSKEEIVGTQGVITQE